MSLAYFVYTRVPALEVADLHLVKVVKQKGAQGDYVGLYGVL